MRRSIVSIVSLFQYVFAVTLGKIIVKFANGFLVLMFSLVYVLQFAKVGKLHASL